MAIKLPDSDILTPAEVATALNMSRSQVMWALAQGYIPAKKIGRRWLILREAIEKFLDEARGK